MVSTTPLPECAVQAPIPSPRQQAVAHSNDLAPAAERVRAELNPPDGPATASTRGLGGDASASARVQELVEQHTDIACSMALRYRNRGLDVDDLQQVALLGLVKAAVRFDPDAGHDFMSYAVPTIRGELRRHFRDCGWMVRPPRRIQELQRHINLAHDELVQVLGRSPRASEISVHLDAEVTDVHEAMAVDGAFAPTSLDQSFGDGTGSLADIVGCAEPGYDVIEARTIVEPLVRDLTDRDRRIVYLRFFEQRSQQEVADDVGLTQAQVSRVLTRILRSLRMQLPTTRGSTP